MFRTTDLPRHERLRRRSGEFIEGGHEHIETEVPALRSDHVDEKATNQNSLRCACCPDPVALYTTERHSPTMRRRNHRLDVARTSRTVPMPTRLTDTLDTSISHPKKVIPAIDVAVATAV